MSQEQSFADLIRRVRDRDELAATELVRRYEPAIRRAVRVRMADARMRRVLDSTDICQSVLGSFFTHAAENRYDLETPDELMKLLIGMVRNKVIDQVRREHAECRDNRRARGDLDEAARVASAEPRPSQLLLQQEMLEEVRRRLTADDRVLLDRREEGLSWDVIAAEVGGTAEALRKRLTRALAEVVRRLDDRADQE